MKIQRKGFNAYIEDNKLHIEVDLSNDGGMSKSGKSLTIASSEGNIVVEPNREIRLGLNVFCKNPGFKGGMARASAVSEMPEAENAHV